MFSPPPRETMEIKNFIGGEFVPPLKGKYLENFNPSIGVAYSLAPDSDATDIEAAVGVAAQAFPSWSQTAAPRKAEYLRLIAKGIRSRLDILAKAEAIDNGKPFSLARTVDVPRSAMNFEFFADAIMQFHGEVFQTNADISNVVDYSPLGVAACISPWNLPLLLLTWKIAPALAAGNTVVAKPSEVTPMTAMLLGEILQEAGLPPGVINIVHGAGARVGAPLVTHPQIKAVSFTGSTATGRVIAEATAKSFKKISLEMGGKNPNIIFDDSDLERAWATTLRSSFSNQGQICLCGSRIFVHRAIYEEFRAGFLSRIKKLKVGDPLDETTDIGALVSKPHFEKVMSYIDIAKKEGGQILCGGVKLNLGGTLKNGYFMEPTLIEGLPSESIVNQEEIFGPVATLIPFSTEDEVIRMANSTRYGLAASLWTRDVSRAQRVSRRLEAGVVWINCWNERDLRTPFGGVKDLGLGREGGDYALKFFSELKNICLMSGESSSGTAESYGKNK